MEIKVRINETDFLGIVNNANYFTYMENGRVAFLEELNIHYMEDGRVAFLEELDMHFDKKKTSIIVASAKCDFIRQSYFNDILIVKTKVSKIGNSSFNLTSYITKKESNELIAKGEITAVYFDLNQQKSIKLPESFKEKLRNKLSN